MLHCRKQQNVIFFCHQQTFLLILAYPATGYLVAEWKRFLFTKIKLLRVVVNDLRLGESTGLLETRGLSHHFSSLHILRPFRDMKIRLTFAHAFANPSKVTYLSPDMLNTCLLAFSLPRTLIKAVARSCKYQAQLHKTRSISY